MKQTIELFKTGGYWHAYFVDVEGMPREVMQTPFNQDVPFEVVSEKIKKYSYTTHCEMIDRQIQSAISSGAKNHGPRKYGAYYGADVTQVHVSRMWLKHKLKMVPATLETLRM